jgi:hypothetical protein
MLSAKGLKQGRRNPEKAKILLFLGCGGIPFSPYSVPIRGRYRSISVAAYTLAKTNM